MHPLVVAGVVAAAAAVGLAAAAGGVSGRGRRSPVGG